MKAMALATFLIVAALPAAEIDHEAFALQLRKMGGQVFTNKSTGKITEVNLNGHPGVTTELLTQIGRVKSLKDLSLEDAPVSDEGIAALRSLPNLEWLNLYRIPWGMNP